MTYEQFNEDFKQNELRYVAEIFEQDGIPDKPARREEYNNKSDSYCKSGIITDEQYNNWSIPNSLETTLYWL